MSTAIATAQDATEKNIYETLALRGDLSGLKPEDKAKYLQRLCESLGLNPYTQPFIPLKLSGKEVLYASKGATDQLASINKLTREILNKERIEDVYIVTCKVTSPDGRFDISTGAVTIGNSKGDALANALMKAETKAKRRATLSFCGLGFLDESEIETIPANKIERVPPAALPASDQQIIDVVSVENQQYKPNAAPAPAPSSGSKIKDFHLNKEKSLAWREAIVEISAAAGKDATATLKYFDENPNMHERCYLKVRNSTIETLKKTIDQENEKWGSNEQGTIDFLANHGITGAIDAASDGSIVSLVKELHELDLL